MLASFDPCKSLSVTTPGGDFNDGQWDYAGLHNGYPYFEHTTSSRILSFRGTSWLFATDLVTNSRSGQIESTTYHPEDAAAGTVEMLISGIFANLGTTITCCKYLGCQCRGIVS